MLCSAILQPGPRQPTAHKQSLLHDDEDDEEDVPERLSSSDVWLFPIVSICVQTGDEWGSSIPYAFSHSHPHQVGSAVLFGLYMVVKYVGKEWINWLLGWYFAIAGVGSVWRV